MQGREVQLSLLQKPAIVLSTPAGPVLAYAGMIGLAEVVGIAAGVYYGTWLHALLVPTLLNHYIVASQAPYRRILPVLALLPLLRILSLVMPVPQAPQIYWYALVGAPLLLAAALTIRLLKLSGGELGLRLRPRMWPMQLAIALTGVPLGLAGFLIVLPQPIIPSFNSRDAAIAVVILLVFTGLAEELVFRGLLQSMARETLGRTAVYLSTALFATMYLGSFSARYVLFMTLVGLFFGWCADRTGSIWGAILSRGLLSVGMLVFWPFTNTEFNRELIARLSAATQLALWLLGVIVIGLLLVALLRQLRGTLLEGLPPNDSAIQLTGRVVTAPVRPRNPHDTQPLAHPAEGEDTTRLRGSNSIPLVALLVFWQLLGLGLCAVGFWQGSALFGSVGQPTTGPTPQPTRSVTPQAEPSPTATSVSYLFGPLSAPGPAWLEPILDPLFRDTVFSTRSVRLLDPSPCILKAPPEYQGFDT